MRPMRAFKRNNFDTHTTEPASNIVEDIITAIN